LKVVLFCGGQGLRLREYSESIPKPMVPIGYRPILWHVMRYYASFGHTEFILCLGYRADLIKEYFLQYRETISNDFVLNGPGGEVELLGEDLAGWRISFVDTGQHATVGERLMLIREHIGDDEIFLANYGDVLTDAPLDDMVERFSASDATATFLCVRPRPYTFHLIDLEADRVTGVRDVGTSDLWINGGYFALRRRVFDELEAGQDLVPDAFRRLMDRNELSAYPYEGFWAPMDTIKDRQILESEFESGHAPWAVWQRRAGADLADD
jgi:glucose-1-phosphate cytidylyltransferase